MGNIFDGFLKKGRKVPTQNLTYTMDMGSRVKPVKVQSTSSNNDSLKEEIRALKQAIEERKDPEVDMTPFAAKLDEIILKFDEQKKETQEIIHSENVKVYRNVQAVVVDESSKVKDALKKSTVKAAKKANLAFVFALLAFVFAVLDLAFNILVKFNVF